MNINKKIYLISLSGLIILGMLSLGISVFFLNMQGKLEIQEYENAVIYQRKQGLRSLIQSVYIFLEKNYQNSVDPEKFSALYLKELKNLINIPFKMIETIYQLDNISEEKKKEMVIKIIETLRYNNDEYFWINDMKPSMIMHPYSPELNGRDISGLTDPNGKRLFVEMANQCKVNGEGSVTYMWSMPGSSKAVPKLSYVKLFKPWNWIIGTGVYMETAEKEIKESSKTIINTLKYGSGNEDYFYIFNTVTKKMVQHPRPDLINTDIDSNIYTDHTGQRILSEQLKIALEKEQGFSYYKWPKLGKKDPVSKITYLKLFKPWNWVIATGVYMDDIESDIMEKQVVINQNIRRQSFLLILSIISVIIAVLTITYIFIQKNIYEPVNSSIEGLTNCAGSIKFISDNIAEYSTEVNKSVSVQLTQHTEIISLLDETILNIQQNTDNAGKMKILRDDSLKSLVNAAETISLAVEAVNRIRAKGEETRRIIKTIDEIAFQTNLLSLNASIEAARTGETGLGFAVVAGEVRKLAVITGNSSKNIKDIIEDTLKEISIGFDLIQKTSEVFKIVNENNQNIAELIDKVLSASDHQTQLIKAVSKNIKNITMIIQKYSSKTNSFVLTSKELDTHSEHMKGFTNKFKLLIKKSF
ncbi:Methyl-accepting chemotaxis protein signaling domain-containing protein, double cache domain-containing protein [Desulfonema limicola]|uniref:Methyl-accepting chemotaxis protein signaling domain-containing protein, double cache domain-containing protein n=1 Tax=Desulfonema limicola TaxID=45656 RepID=A0A975B6Z4_9BACT|nr:cache domain-containing protein [Desulfonema limicola]QTA79999.1 Methyl-accepting chemotaxis protein signaling domain-containing protein, double cache domain-containing protein [Desulfonema limicola]